LTPDEQKRILVEADKFRHVRHPDARYYVLFSLLLNTGIKKGECLSLALNHIDLEAPNGPFVFIRYPWSGNRYKERKIICRRIGWSPMVNSWRNFNPWTGFFPGHPAAWNTCWKTWAGELN